MKKQEHVRLPESSEDMVKAAELSPTSEADEQEQLRKVAWDYLTAASENGKEDGTDTRSDNDATPEVGGGEGGLSANLLDVKKVLQQAPQMAEDNAFHDTLNGHHTISCPYVLSRKNEKKGVLAVVRFGKSTAGYPKVVHGGITALTFDNLFGWALFVKGTGAVVTAYLKVNYQAPLKTLSTCAVDISIDRIEGRKMYMSGRLHSLDGETQFSSSEALFIKPRPEKAPKGVEGIERAAT